MTAPLHPKIYHIVHFDRLKSIIHDGNLWCDAETQRRQLPGTSIGMSKIKLRRLRLTLTSHPDLHVGDCVPFYFCPRSVMLFLIARQNHGELGYRGGQGAIVHLESDLQNSIEWAKQKRKRWAFTLSNAGASYFEDRCNLTHLNEIDWTAVQSNNWSGNNMEGKQAEFLIEYSFPWHLVHRIGVYSEEALQQVVKILPDNSHRPIVEIRPTWYY